MNNGSHSKNNGSHSNNNNLTKDQVASLKQDMVNYNNQHKVRFYTFGFSQFRKYCKTYVNHEKYDETVDKFKFNYSVYEQLNEYDQACIRHVVGLWSQKHPNANPQKVEKAIKTEQSSQYRPDNPNEDNGEFPHREANFRDKVDNKAQDHGESLPVKGPGVQEKK